MAGNNRTNSILLLGIVIVIAVIGLCLGFMPPEQWQQWLP